MKRYRFQLTGIVSAYVVTIAAFAQTPKDFDACRIFTAADAESTLGSPVVQEPVNSKVKPKVILTCKYTATSGDARFAMVTFRFARNAEEAKSAYSESRLELRGKPTIISGRDANWNEKQGQLNLLSGNAWLVIDAGPSEAKARDSAVAKKLAETLIPKL